MNGMCGAPGITAKRAPGIASAIFCTTGGGLDLSNSPTRHSAGTLISRSRGAVSIVAIAFQASAQPCTSVESRRSRTAASPPASTNASLNQRRIVTSRMLPMPSRFASAPRCATILALSGVCADGHEAITIARTSCGYLTASACVTIPPNAKPATAHGAKFSSVSSACTSSA